MKLVEVQEAQESSTGRSKENSKGNVEQGMIHKVIFPLTVSMRIFGLYFEKTDKLRTTKQYSRFYCLLIVVILWLNAIRIFTIFTRSDKMVNSLGNCGAVAWMAISAVLQTSCYRASQKGRIQEVLQTFNKDMSSRWAKHLRVRVILCVVIAWIFTAFSVVSTAYVLLAITGFSVR